MAERDSLLLKPGSHWQDGAGEHPSEEAWALLAAGELCEEERLAVLDHVVGCEHCSRIYRALVTLEESAREVHLELPAGGLVRLHGARRLPFSRAALGGVALAAAAAALILGVGIYRPPRVPVERPDTTRSIGTERPALLAPLESSVEEPVFRWQPLEGAAGYRLELLDANAEPLWTGEVGKVDIYPWPAEVPRQAGRYYWRVAALLEGGGERVSALASFEIVHRP